MECARKTVRTNEKVKQLVNRLNRLEGQVHGIRKMVENDAYCIDILVQVYAVQGAINSFLTDLLADHIKGCVLTDINRGNEESLDELVSVLQRILK